MSAIGGIYRADGSPIDRELLEKMRDIVDYRGPDGSGIWINEKVGFVHRLLWNSEESVHEKQPMTNGRGLWITADCRIDNREELKKEFESHGVWTEMQKLFDPYSPPDSAYILFAYELWGEDAPNHLLGDFAFAIWDERNQKLFCARDHIGIKPFVYHWNGKKIIFGSEMKQLFQNPRVPSDINQIHLAEILWLGMPRQTETPYEAIRRLPPAHLLRIERGSLMIKRYWHWHPDSEPLSHASEKENAETFLHLFQEAVRARLRVPSGFRAGSFLSGGLDSSSIVSVAATLQKASPVLSNSGFPVFNLHFSEAKPTYQLSNFFDPMDESPYIEVLTKKYNLELRRIEVKGWGPLDQLEENLWHQENPLFAPGFTNLSHLLMTARDSNVRILLSGNGGDEIFMPGSQYVVNEFREGDFKKFFREARANKRKWGVSYGNLLNGILRSFIPDRVKTLLRRFRRIVPPWIDPQFAKRVGLRERLEEKFRWNRAADRSPSYGILILLWEESAPFILETFNRAAAAYQTEIRFPFLDLRLFRFCATLSWDQKVRQGVTKFLLRLALKEFLPSLVQTRLQKSEGTPVIRAALERYALKEMKETFESPHPILRSIIVPKKVRHLYNVYFNPENPRSPLKITGSTWYLWYLLSVDQWLKKGRWEKTEEVSA